MVILKQASVQCLDTSLRERLEYQIVTNMREYGTRSFEELCLKDYELGLQRVKMSERKSVGTRQTRLIALPCSRDTVMRQGVQDDIYTRNQVITIMMAYENKSIEELQEGVLFPTAYVLNS